MPIDQRLRGALPAAVRPRDTDEWTNWHRNLTVDIDGYFDVTNPAQAPTVGGYRKTTAAIQRLLGLAVERQVGVRPFGATWSFSKIAASPGWMVDTAYLNWVFPLLSTILTGRHAGRSNELFLVQAGIRISQLNRVLEKSFQRSLNTSGASNGQTLGGALATGTHGSAIEKGGLQNHVVGLHLIAGPDRHLWIERASDPATEDRFAALLGARLIRDDDLFEAARVGLGAMGFLAGVLIATEPLFRLRASRGWRSYDTELQQLVSSLDFSTYHLPGSDPGTAPYYFHVAINPFNLQKAAVTAMVREPYRGEPIDYAKHDEVAPGYEMLSVLGSVTDLVGASIPVLVNTVLGQSQKPFDGQEGTLGETFDFTPQRTGAVGAAVAVPLDRAVDALKLILEEVEDRPAPVLLLVRFARPTGATLEFTRYPMNCVIDIDGAFSDRSHDLIHRSFARLEAAGVPFTEHWGKINDYDSGNLRARYGDAAVDGFWAARKRILPSAEERALFATPFLEKLGLAE